MHWSRRDVLETAYRNSNVLYAEMLRGTSYVIKGNAGAYFALKCAVIGNSPVEPTYEIIEASWIAQCSENCVSNFRARIHFVLMNRKTAGGPEVKDYKGICSNSFLIVKKVH